MPTVTGRDPLWTEKRAEEAAELLGLLPRAPVAIHPDPQVQRVHMPNPSFWPFIAASGVSLLFIGFLTPFRLGPVPAITAISIAVLIVGIYAWSCEPAD